MNELTPKFRGSQILELANFKTATVEDIANVHDKAYVFGLEKAMDEASDSGLIFIEGSGPTYATSTVTALCSSGNISKGTILPT
jgi:HKD family nuclease